MQNYRKIAALTILSLGCVSGAYANALVSLSVTNLTTPIYTNETYKNVELHVNNLTSKPLYINQLTAPSYPEGFTVTANSNTCTDVTIAAGGYCKVVGTFAPTKSGAHTWTTAVAAENYLWQLQYTAAVNVTDSSARLGMLTWKTPLSSVVVAGGATANVVLNVNNDTGATLTFDDPAITFTSPDATDFSAKPQTTCGNTLVADASCTYTWQFETDTVGVKSLTASVNYNNGRTSSPLTTNTTVSAYQVTPIVEPEHCKNCMGTMTPNAPQAITAGNTASFDLAAITGATMLGASSNCGGSLNNATYTTDSIGQVCAVYGAFLKEYPITTASSNATAIATGADGNVWFLENDANKVAKITPAGIVTEYTIPTADSSVHYITAGPDSNVWFSETLQGNIAKVNANGTITTYDLSAHDLTLPTGITAGPDGNIWFATAVPAAVHKMATDGTLLASYSLAAGSLPGVITAGPDGNLWFIANGKVNKITTSGTITSYELPLGVGTNPQNIVKGADGNLWITFGTGGYIGKVTIDGIFTEYLVSDIATFGGLTLGPDGNIWFTATESAGLITSNLIGKITSGGIITLYELSANTGPSNLTVGADGNIWFIENIANKIAVL